MKIKDLQTRYSLKTRKSIYEWCKAVNVELAKDSIGHAYATPEQIEKLDRLAEHLRNPNATLANFIPISTVSIEPINTPINIPVNSSDRLHDNLLLLLGTLERFEKIAQSFSSDPLQYMTSLERAADRNWILSSSEVEKLIGVKPRAGKDKRLMTRGCWSFIKTGKIGHESGWRVVKEADAQPPS